MFMPSSHVIFTIIWIALVAMFYLVFRNYFTRKKPSFFINQTDYINTGPRLPAVAELRLSDTGTPKSIVNFF